MFFDQGFYGAANMILDSNKIPSMVPTGRFVLDIISFNDTTEIMHTKSQMLIEEVSQ